MVASVRGGSGQRLRLVLHRQNAVADRQSVADRQLLQAARTLGADMVVMCRLAADHAAERDKPLKPVVRPRRKPDRRRDLKRTGNSDRLMGRTGGGECALGAAAKLGSDVAVVEGLDDEDMRRCGHGAGRRSRAT